MKQVIFFTLLLFINSAFSACENQLHGIGGGGTTDSSDASQSNRNTRFANSDLGAASLNGQCDEQEFGKIVVVGTSPGPGWFPHFAPIGSWIYLGGGGGGDGGGGGSSMSAAKISLL